MLGMRFATHFCYIKAFQTKFLNSHRNNLRKVVQKSFFLPNVIRVDLRKYQISRQNFHILMKLRTFCVSSLYWKSCHLNVEPRFWVKRKVAFLENNTSSCFVICGQLLFALIFVALNPKLFFRSKLRHWRLFVCPVYLVMFIILVSFDEIVSDDDVNFDVEVRALGVGWNFGHFFHVKML